MYRQGNLKINKHYEYIGQTLCKNNSLFYSFDPVLTATKLCNETEPVHLILCMQVD